MAAFFKIKNQREKAREMYQHVKPSLMTALLYMVGVLAVVDLLPRLGKRELICLLLFTCNLLEIVHDVDARILVLLLLAQKCLVCMICTCHV